MLSAMPIYLKVIHVQTTISIFILVPHCPGIFLAKIVKYVMH
jgi:hypothetical protein